MKFYFKSPEEVRSMIEKQKTIVHPYRNRTFAIVFMNIVLILGVYFGIRHMPGVIVESLDSKKEIQFGTLMLSASASGLLEGDEKRKFFLKVHNTGDRAIIFPDNTSRYNLNRSHLQVLFTGKTASVPVITEIFLERRSILPGETELYTFQPAMDLPDNPAGFQFILEFSDGRVVIGSME